MRVPGRLWSILGWQVLVAVAISVLNYFVAWSSPAPNSFVPGVVWWSGFAGMIVAMMTASEFGFSYRASVLVGLASNAALWTLVLVGISRLVAFVKKSEPREKSSAA